MDSIRGFEELPHTADVSIRAWAEDLPALFEQAARGMNTLAGVVIAPEDRIRQVLELDAESDESLLVAFLSELAFELEQHSLGFDNFEMELRRGHLHVAMQGGPLSTIARHIKAVTFHNLAISKLPDRYEVEIVFDV